RSRRRARPLARRRGDRPCRREPSLDPNPNPWSSNMVVLARAVKSCAREFLTFPGKLSGLARARWECYFRPVAGVGGGKVARMLKRWFVSISLVAAAGLSPAFAQDKPAKPESITARKVDDLVK